MMKDTEREYWKRRNAVEKIIRRVMRENKEYKMARMW